MILRNMQLKKGVRVSMTPSATPNVTKETIQKAKEVGLARWAFSLDGPTAEIHDHFRGTQGSFELTIRRLVICTNQKFQFKLIPLFLDIMWMYLKRWQC